MTLFGFRLDSGDEEIIDEFVKDTNRRMECYTIPQNPFCNDSRIYKLDHNLYVAHLKPIFFSLGLGNRFFLYFMLKKGMKKKGFKGKTQMLRKNDLNDLIITTAFPPKTLEKAK